MQFAISQFYIANNYVMQEALRKVVKGVGGLSHSEWRSFENERRIGTGRPEEQRLFVDGDLIEQFLELR